MLTDSITRRTIPLLLLALCWPAAGTAAENTGDDPEPMQIGVDEICQRIGNKLASVSVRECLQQGMEISGGVSVEGQPIVIKTFPPSTEAEPVGRVLLLGGLHGDEYASVSVVFKWMNGLDENPSDLFHWQIAPLVNPDGLLRDNSRRLNARGVDLNRNFPMPDWEHAVHGYWINRTRRNPDHYPGPSPLSEPETRWIAEEIERFQPDAIIAVHAPYNAADYDDELLEASSRLGRLYLESPATFPGSLGRYAGIELGIPLLTLELPYAGRMPNPEEISEIWDDVTRWLRDNASENAGQKVLRGADD